MTAACPLCQRGFSAGNAGMMAGGDSVVCPVCEVRWDAARLETVAAYARFVADRAAPAAAAGPGKPRAF